MKPVLRFEIAEQVSSKRRVRKVEDDSLVFHVVGMSLVAFAFDALDVRKLGEVLLVCCFLFAAACLRDNAAVGSSAG